MRLVLTKKHAICGNVLFWRYCIFACLLSIISTTTIAQSLSYAPVFLKNKLKIYPQSVYDWQEQHNKSKYPIQAIVRFNHKPSKEVISSLRSKGVVMLNYLSENACLVSINNSLTESALTTTGITGVVDVQAAWKLSDDVSSLMLTNNQLVNLDVSFVEGIGIEDIKLFISQHQAVIVSNRLNTLGYCQVSVPSVNIKKIADWHGVSYVAAHAEDVPLNINAKAINRGQVASAPNSSEGYGLKGKGVAVGVGDNVSGNFHVDLFDRIINFNPQSYTNHGVHINGIVGGAGIIDPKGEGTAPATTLTNHLYSDVLDATPSIFKQYKVVATNNSYSAFQGSCEYAGTYDGLSAGLDKLCIENDKVLQVFAAANDGLFDCAPYPKGFATIAGGYQVAKNALVVASTDKEYVNADNSSRGPVKDGRLKPEISAVGVNVNSTTRNEEYLVASGTSMACPQVAGAAALITERWKQISPAIEPRSDVLKALLINGATDIGIQGPDFRFGFGFLNIERSLIMLDSNRFVTDDVTNGAQKTFSINVPAGSSALKVFLYWHDVPASAMSAKQLVNDIDLEVTEPGGKLHKPLVLDAAPTQINNPAVEKEDRLNNSEQVVVYNPIAGSYTITIKGHNVTSATQKFVIAYDFLPQGIAVKYPLAGTSVKANDSMYIYWDATTGSNSFTLEYSDNDGAIWNLIDNSIAAEQRHYKWLVPDNINSGKCRIRLKRNSTADESVTGLFIINNQAELQLSGTQCPGYFRLNWGAIPNATGYEILQKAGAELVVIDTAFATEYTLSGLSLDSTYYVSVRPLIDGLSGYRSLSIKRIPNDGDCAGNISDGDIMIDRILSPQSGRVLTSTELGATHLLRVRVRNLDDAVCDSFKLSYNINGGAWQSEVFTTLPANGLKSVNVIGLDLATVGDYVIRVAVENIHNADNVSKNDSTAHYISQLPNNPIALGYIDDFESLLSFESITDTVGFGNDRRWDYEQTTDTGRIRSKVLDDVTINGQYSISLDAYKSCPGNYNGLTGTFNLANYKAETDEVRLEFDYIVHGFPESSQSNNVLIRGSDSRALQAAYAYNTAESNIGRLSNSGSVSLSDVLLETGDDFSTSTQVQFGQNGNTSIGSASLGHGLTIDDVRIYTVQNDVQLLSVVSPENFACGVEGKTPLVVKVRNGVTQPQTDIKLYYRLDNGVTITETISELKGKEQIDFAFNALMDISEFGAHNIDIWLSASGDTYLKNDSILNYTVRNQPIINTFPYVEGFEDGDGYWFSEGINNSWEYGEPTATKINNAGEGTKVWATNLDGSYNDNELSYLYSPCFDISTMDRPKMSVKIAIDIENCGEILCDAAYLEYTTNGAEWIRLVDTNGGVNWYNDTNFQAWNEENKTIWRQAEVYLPVGLANMQLRFVLQTDQGSNREGIAVDDINIYNERLYPPDDNIISISPNPTDNGVVNIEWGAHEGTGMQIIMTDVAGRQVYNTSTTAKEEGYNKTTLQTPKFNTGMYFMRIVIGTKTHKTKIVYRLN